MSESALQPVRLRQLVGYFLRLGTLGFGGPIALAGYMQRDLAEQRRWISKEDPGTAGDRRRRSGRSCTGFVIGSRVASDDVGPGTLFFAWPSLLRDCGEKLLS